MGLKIRITKDKVGYEVIDTKTQLKIHKELFFEKSKAETFMKEARFSRRGAK